MPTTRERVITNRFEGNCTRCGERVEAGVGEAFLLPGQRWQTRHAEGQCQLQAEVATAAADLLQGTAGLSQDQRPLATEGYYYYHQEHVYVVAPSRQTGRLYARRLRLRTGRNAQWVYARGMMTVLREEDRLTVEQATQLGHMHGICAVCGRLLTVPQSVERGIGPVCYGRLTAQRVVSNPTPAPRTRRVATPQPRPIVRQGTLLDELGQGEER